ncbi:MAG: molybdopterin converting factor subunit 1 [Pseudohongiellaceae bacterium]
MLSINYFASVREQAGRAHDQLDMPASVTSIAELIKYLVATDPSRMTMLEDNSVLVAVNQTVVNTDYTLRGDEEVAFFPPMTGG